MLTQEQFDQFHTFGFTVLRNHFNPEEVTRIRGELSGCMETAFQHAPFDGTRRHWLPMMGDCSPFMASLLEDPRFFDAAEQLLGAPALGWLVDANRYVGNTGWHPDASTDPAVGEVPGVKFVFYLDPVGADTGALRVVPGSHRAPLHDQVKEYVSAWGVEDLSRVPAFPCASEPGDVIAFDFPIWHASIGGSRDRSMCTATYFQAPQAEPQAEWIRNYLDVLQNSVAGHWSDRAGHPFFDPSWLANPGGSKRRDVLIRRLRESGLLDQQSATATAT